MSPGHPFSVSQNRRCRVKKQCAAAIMVLVLASTAYATVWYVHPDSTLNSIQTALNSCATNDIVIVGAGTYYEHIIWPATSGIRLVSEYGPDTTIIDGSSTGRVVRFGVQCDTTTMIMGFKITHGYSGSGAGIMCTNHASPKIVCNIIVGNASNDVCGGIYCDNQSSPIIVNNVVRRNTTDYGTAGIGTVMSGTPAFVENIVSGNISGYEAGGIGYGDGAEPSVIGNFVLGNMSVIGGGIGARNTSGPIIGNVVFNNRTDSLGGGIGIRYCDSPISDNVLVRNTSSLAEGGGIGMDNSNPTIEGCHISENTGNGIFCENNSAPTIHYCDIMDNAGYALLNVSTVTIDAENNWWGDATGPYHSTNPGGLGDTVSDYVDFNPWLQNPGVTEITSAEPVTHLLKVSPNPFTHQTQIRYLIMDSRFLMQNPRLEIYDVSGRLVRSFNLESSIQNQGSAISWRGDDNAGRKLPSGVYFVKFSSDDYEETEKVLLIR